MRPVVPGPWNDGVTTAEINERWDAVTLPERERFMRFGSKPALDESPPDYAARILKFDPKISLPNTGRLVAIFRAAYDEMASS